MAFKSEDGSGVVGANAYGTVAGFKAYHADRATDVSAITDTAIEALLVKATDYIGQRWGPAFKGGREYNGLVSRSVLALTGVPLADEYVVIGTDTYTFKTTASEANDFEVQINSNLLTCLSNLATALAATGNESFVGTFFVDPDVAEMVIMVADDDVATIDTLTNGSFDQPLSYGSSSRLQPLDFPRDGVYDSEGYQVIGVPDKLIYATYEYALRANSAALSPDPTINTVGRVTGTSNKVGPITTETRYSETSLVRITQPYPAADRLLSEYIKHNSGGVIRN